MTCKDCVHYKPCFYANIDNCGMFKDKSKFIELPCKVGDKVWFIGTPCGGCEYYNEIMKEEFIEKCRKCEKTEIIECKFDYDLIGEFGKTVFLTREAAEAALKEREQNV